MVIELLGKVEHLVTNKNGDQLASFYHCSSCGDLLAVGCEIDGQLRGAVNALLLDQRASLGTPVQIQPKFLPSAEKLSRWKTLWGKLTVDVVRSESEDPELTSGEHR
jgi:hypothetical protein